MFIVPINKNLSEMDHSKLLTKFQTKHMKLLIKMVIHLTYTEII